MPRALSNFQIHLKHCYKGFSLNIRVKIKNLPSIQKEEALCFVLNKPGVQRAGHSLSVLQLAWLGQKQNIDWYFATSSDTVGCPFYIYVGLLQQACQFFNKKNFNNNIFKYTNKQQKKTNPKTPSCLLSGINQYVIQSRLYKQNQGCFLPKEAVIL